MSDKLHKRIQLADKDYRAIKQLFTNCVRHDKGTPRMYWNCIKSRAPDVYHDYLYYKRQLLTAYLGIFNFNANEVEICALVHPLHRQKGLFRQLLVEAIGDINYKSFERILLPCAEGFVPAKEAFTSIGATYKHSEYTLEVPSLQKLEFDSSPKAAQALSYTPATENDVEIIAQLDSACFKSPIEEGRLRFGQTMGQSDRQAYFAHLDGKTIGKIHIHFFESKAFIHDFCIAPEYQGKCFGRDLLVHTMELLKQQGHRKIELDVIATNKQAIQLYQNNGFDLVNAYDYWLLKPDDLDRNQSESHQRNA